MYVSAADNGHVGVTGTFLGTAAAESQCASEPAAGRSPGLVQQSAGTLDLCSTQIRASAFEGESVFVTDLLALTGLATLDGLTAPGNVGCDQRAPRRSWTTAQSLRLRT